MTGEVLGEVKVCEICSALQGEGRYTGYATTFIQEPIDLAKGTDWSIDRILSKVNKLGNRHVCIKGETLLQEDSYTLVYELLAYSYIVTMETSCRIPLEDCLYDRTYAYNVIINCAKENILNNLRLLHSNDEVKFVIKDDSDFDYVKKALKKYPTSAMVTLYPFKNDLNIFKKIEDFLIKNRLNARAGLKLHKLI